MGNETHRILERRTAIELRLVRLCRYMSEAEFCELVDTVVEAQKRRGTSRFVPSSVKAREAFI
jgi:hypothetical protein